jgi:signal transduction histidine kinase
MGSVFSLRSLRDKVVLLRAGRFPVAAFVSIVAAVCVGLLLSAVHSYVTLSRLRIQYLHNRALEIATAADVQVRGPGRRNNPDFWQRTLQESVERNQAEVSFMTLLSRDGTVLTAAGDASAAASLEPGTLVMLHGTRIFVFDFPLVSPRQMPRGVDSALAGWRLRVGLNAAAADFIRTQAVVHVVITCIAVLALVAVSYYLLLTLGRFVDLKAREESERHLRILGSMSATLAHEIRNPLGAMKGLTQLVQEELPEDHRTQELLRTVVSEAQRLEKLISSLLDFARPRAPQLREFDFRLAVSEVHEMLRPRAAEANTALCLDAGTQPILMRSDPDSIRQVLLNVLLNALDATPQGGAVTFRARTDSRGGRLRIEIDDTGPGLPALDPEELFQPFVTTKTQGTGLGLAVTRRIVDSLGGTIALLNQPGGGARCVIELPLNAPARQNQPLIGD